MWAISGRDASCRATSLPIPALAPVINADFTRVVPIVIASLLVEVQPGSAVRHGRAAGGCGGGGPCSAGRSLLGGARPRTAPSSFRDARKSEIVARVECTIHPTRHHMA